MTPDAEEQVGEALNDIYRHYADGSYEQLITALTAVEARFAASLDEPQRLELRRRVAESRLMAAQVTRQSVELCEELLAGVVALGWTSLYAKVGALGPLSRYCLDSGRPDVGLRHLTPLVAEVEAEHRRSGEERWRNVLDGLKPLLVELQQAVQKAG